MNIIKNYAEKKLTLSIEGRIDALTSESLKEEINSELNNLDSLILDFTNVDYISSAGLRVLIATQKKMKPHNIPFIIKNVNNAVSEIFRMSGFNNILKIE
ncbi:STAS domain-containing protein [Methanobrevibacter woesei]|uniref:STAS domain-containing protein n=1 Tax=Methanobrevibacter woesei TaxID=190976 RepID=UPI00255B711A|nr:STAS domain-containing protein [Methanobrevibacter woesei]